MANFIGSVIGPVIEVGKLLIPPFLSNLGYFIYCKRNIRDLRKQMEQLGKLRADVEQAVVVALSNGQMIKETVRDWLDRVKAMESEVVGLTAVSDAIEENKGCLQGGYRARYHVGKEAKSKADAVKKLLGECKSNDVSIPPGPPVDIETMPTPDFQVYGPTKLAMEQIREAVVDKKFKLVGVYGMGGVGKTTLTKQIAKELKNEGLFDRVVMVTVSQNLILKKIQGEIAENLGFKIQEDSESVRARRLLERMKQEKRILIIYDDLWEELNLSEVGIPYGVDGGGWNCSIIITTRNLEVCNQMQTECNVEVKHLPVGDSWQLFKMNAGDLVDSAEMRDVAMEVVKACDGLPVAPVTVGRALGDKDLKVWHDAATQLKNSISSTIPEGISKKVISSIKLSYDYLQSEETKLCFLLCCSFPEDFVIYEDDLLPYVWGEKVFKSINTLKEARNRLHTVLNALKRSCLLLKVDRYGEQCVRMHDIIRAVAIWIASQEEHGFVVEAGKGLKEWPVMEDQQIKHCKRLSLMHNNIRKLPDQISCPKLMSLSIPDNYYLSEIPDGSFEGLMALKVLDLNQTLIRSLPSSFSCLTELRVLYLKRTFIPYDPSEGFDLSILGNLNKLEILTLEGCNLQTLPQEFEGLTQLKSLNLSENLRLVIPPRVISSLSRLEELNLVGSFNNWEAGESEDRKKACLSEVASLPSLTNLQLEVTNIQCLNAVIPWPWNNLTEFSIYLGHSNRGIAGIDEGYYETMMCFANLTIPKLSNWPWVEVFLGQTKKLILESCCGPKNISPELSGGSGLNNLQSLTILGDTSLEYIIFSDEAKEVPTIPFRNLEYLQLCDQRYLSKICHGDFPTNILTSLRRLTIRGCPSLKNVFQMSMAQGLAQLEQIEIINCAAFEEIFAKNDGENEGKVVLPRLRVLRLSILPNFSMVCQDLSLIDFPGIEELYIDRCPDLKKFPINPSPGSTPRLGQITAEERWFNDLEWDEPSDMSLLQERVKVKFLSDDDDQLPILGLRQWLCQPRD